MLHSTFQGERSYALFRGGELHRDNGDLARDGGVLAVVVGGAKSGAGRKWRNSEAIANRRAVAIDGPVVWLERDGGSVSIIDG